MSPALSVSNVSKRFGAQAVLNGVSFEAAAGEAVVIVGPSGSGKTTLLRSIAGLDEPDAGEIRLNGATVSQAGRSTVPPHRRGIGFVFQDLALWPHLAVRRSLEFVLDAGRVPRAEREARIRDTLRSVRLEGFAGRYPHELSGGEQQRAAMARALVGRPRVLLLDEPLSSLDPELRSALREELRLLQRSLQVTMLYVTHDREDAAVLADRVMEMRAGRIVATSLEPRRETGA